jgi:hypothetical protein
VVVDRLWAAAATCALTLVTLLTASSTPAFAHDIPRDVTVQMFIRPEGRTLHILARVPLRGITDVEYSRRERDYVDLAHVDAALKDAATVWFLDALDLYADDRPLATPHIVATRMSLESDMSFASYDRALAHVTGPPLPETTTLFWEQGLVDVLADYPIDSDQARFSIHARLERLALTVVTALRFSPPGGPERAFELTGDAGLVRLDPRWHQAAWRFVRLGFAHILDGTDHLLFLGALVIPFRRWRPLVAIVTGFTAAHSLTLIASALGYAPGALWFPPLVELLIAVSIVYMALENIVAPTLQRRWAVAFGFGLVHGFGFSFGLQHTLQFAGSHLLTSLLAFNVGVEAGQLLVLAVLVPILGLVFRALVPERMGTIILSAFIAHTGWHWTLDRFSVLRQFPRPAVGVRDLADGLRWLMALVVVAGAAWAAGHVALRQASARRSSRARFDADAH